MLYVCSGSIHVHTCTCMYMWLVYMYFCALAIRIYQNYLYSTCISYNWCMFCSYCRLHVPT